MRVAIYGAGAMGTILGAYVARAGKQIDLINRNKAHIEALKKNGAHVVGTVDFVQPVRALFPEEITGKYDIIFLMTRQSQNREIVSSLQNFLSETGVICTTQNGLPEPLVAEIIGADRTYGCAVAWGATFIGEGKSELTSDPSALTFALGAYRYKKSDERLRKIKEYLECMGSVTVENNFIGARWSKLIINAAFSGISTFTGLTFGAIAREETGKRAALAVIREGITVANASDVKLAKIQGHNVMKLLGYRTKLRKKISLKLLPLVMKKHEQLTSGMLYALRQGKKCDVDYIDGVISEYGKKYGVRTPVCDKICAVVHEIEDGKRTICVENLRDFTALIE